MSAGLVAGERGTANTSNHHRGMQFVSIGRMVDLMYVSTEYYLSRGWARRLFQGCLGSQFPLVLLCQLLHTSNVEMKDRAVTERPQNGQQSE